VICFAHFCTLLRGNMVMWRIGGKSQTAFFYALRGPNRRTPVAKKWGVKKAAIPCQITGEMSCGTDVSRESFMVPNQLPPQANTVNKRLRITLTGRVPNMKEKVLTNQ
jgi:hypothetical protein